MNDTSTILIAVMAAVGVLALIALIVFLVFRRRQQKKEAAAESKENAGEMDWDDEAIAGVVGPSRANSRDALLPPSPPSPAPAAESAAPVPPVEVTDVDPSGADTTAAAAAGASGAAEGERSASPAPTDGGVSTRTYDLGARRESVCEPAARAESVVNEPHAASPVEDAAAEPNAV